MGERSKGKLSHASSYASSRTDRFHGGISPPDTYWKNHRENNPSLPNWPRDRRQAGGTDNPAANYYINDSYRRLKKLAIPNLPLANYSSVQNTEPLFRCPQNHRSTRNKVSLVNNNMGVMRKGNEFKEDVENDADDDDDDDDEVGGDPYYDDEVNAGEEGEDIQDDSCGSCETIDKDRDDLDEDVDDSYGVPTSLRRLSMKYEKDPLAVMERLKMLDLAQAKLKMSHQRRLQKKYQEMATSHRGCQEIPVHDVSDEITEDDGEISSRLFSCRKITKQPMNCRQPSSWLSSRNQDKYSPIKSSQQAYNYSRKNETIRLALEPSVESYRQKRTCRYCGGTGSTTEPAISKKNNCRVHESTKVSFKTKEKFDGESGDPGERCTSGRRISPRSNFANISPTTLSSQKPRRSRITRSPNRA